MQTLTNALTRVSLAIARLSRSTRRIAAAALLLLVCLTGGTAGAQQPPSSPTPAQEGFVPVDQLKPQEQIPAAPLVMAAYAVAWIAIFVYVWSIWERLGRVEREIAELNRRVETGGRR